MNQPLHETSPRTTKPDDAAQDESSDSTASGRLAAVATTLFALATLAALLTGLAHRYEPEITVGDLEHLVFHLAGDVYRGRESGTEDSRKAARFIAGRFDQMGLAPAFSDSEDHEAGLNPYLQSFSFEAGVKIGATNRIRWTPPAEGADAPEDVPKKSIEIKGLPLPLSAPGTANGELVFLGHCLQVPDGQNDFAGRDLTNQIAVCLRYGPGGKDSPNQNVQIGRAHV